MLVGCVIYYEDCLDLLERCFTSLRARVDRLVAVDGAYESFPHDLPWSSEAHLQVAKRYADVLWSTGVPWADEIEKRNSYLEHCDPGDWVLVLDADEELHGRLPVLDEAQVGYNVTLHQDWLQPRPVFRFFRMSEGLHYRGAHNALFDAEGRLLNHEVTETLPNLNIEHHAWKRPAERVSAKGIYVRALAERERAFREEYKL